jgi:tRNA (guanine37-N1)-methyltransferase
VAYTLREPPTPEASCFSRSKASTIVTAPRRLVGSRIVVRAAELPPPGEDEFYYHEVAGFRVETTAGEPVGTIEETFPTGLNHVWVVRDGEREHLIPVIADVVRAIDRPARRVVIEPMPRSPGVRRCASHVLSIFPETFGSALATGVLRRARERGVVEIFLHQIRDYASGRHLQVDDAPYGGGQGMVMMPEPLVSAIEHVAAAERPRRILLSPKGPVLTHARARALASEPALLLVCARYEGVDERVLASVDEELSIGDYVLSGGELAALVVIDAVVRLLPGAVGNEASPEDDSHATGPPRVPAVHPPGGVRGAGARRAARRRPRRDRALAAAGVARDDARARPDLLAHAPLDADDRAFCATLGLGTA